MARAQPTSGPASATVAADQSLPPGSCEWPDCLDLSAVVLNGNQWLCWKHYTEWGCALGHPPPHKPTEPLAYVEPLTFEQHTMSGAYVLGNARAFSDWLERLEAAHGKLISVFLEGSTAGYAGTWIAVTRRRDLDL